jgi:hypothetical protein
MRNFRGRRALLGAATTMVIGLGAAAGSAGATGPLTLEGALHEHSGYSDGWPGSTPRTYYAAGKAAGLDFMGGADHSDNVFIPFVFSEYCLTDINACRVADPVVPADSYRKWPATLEQADAATTPAFTAFRGFEWTSDPLGHVNVYFSSNVVSAKATVSTTDLLWKWLRKPAAAGGGDDGIATFNHPGAKGTPGTPEFNWHDFAYRRSVDDQVVGIETFNDHQDYGSAGAAGDPPAEGWYAHALDRGWHVGAIGAEDLGHHKTDDWGGPSWAKTVVLADGRTRADIKAAMLARHFYAVRRPGIRLDFTVDGKPMGTRFDAAPGATLHVAAAATAPAAEGDDLRLDLITSGGDVLATGDGTLSTDVTASAEDRWYYVRVRGHGSDPDGGQPIAYSSPVWTTTALAPETDPALPDPDPKPDPKPKPKPKPVPPGRTTIVSAATLRPDARGRVALRLHCLGGTACGPTTRLAARLGGHTVTVGRATRTTIGPAATATVRVPLSRAARRVVTAKGRLSVRVAAGSARTTITVRRRR